MNEDLAMDIDNRIGNISFYIGSADLAHHFVKLGCVCRNGPEIIFYSCRIQFTDKMDAMNAIRTAIND